MGIQTDCARCFALLKQVLCDVDHTSISVMPLSRKPYFNFFFIFVSQHIVKDDQVRCTGISDDIILVIGDTKNKIDLRP